jgi:hypothetical protein
MNEGFRQDAGQRFCETLECREPSGQLDVLERDGDVRVGSSVATPKVRQADLLAAVDPETVLAVRAEVVVV